MSPRSQALNDCIDDSGGGGSSNGLRHRVSSDSLCTDAADATTADSLDITLPLLLDEQGSKTHVDTKPWTLEMGIKRLSTTGNATISTNSDNHLHNTRQSSSSSSSRPNALVPPVTTTLPLLVFLDMLAVSLVVPLLIQYYKNAGVTSAAQRELLSSVYSSSQIVGGLLFGVLADAGKVHRRTILLISYIGSFISYGMLMIHGDSSSNMAFYTIVLSRVLVGLAKQSTTVTISVITAATTTESRAKHLGRVTSASTAAWIVGPTIGALLYKYVGPGLPCAVACALFAVNIVLTLLLLRDDDMKGVKKAMESSLEVIPSKAKKATAAVPMLQSVWSNLQTCFSSPALGSVVAVSLIVTWVTRATNYSQLGNFYEDMYGLEPHQRGYIYSYQQALQFVVQSALVERLLRVMGHSERRTICVFTALLALAVLLEAQKSLWLFVAILCPMISVSFAITNVTLQSLVTHVAPAHAMFSVLAALDVLQNAVSVTVPFYRTALFQVLPQSVSSAASNTNAAATATLRGDPDPVAWVLSCAAHWFVASICITSLLWSKRYKSSTSTADSVSTTEMDCKVH